MEPALADHALRSLGAERFRHLAVVTVAPRVGRMLQ